jgi:pimeloyl-ACP methyl ester carboxylesterase
MSASLLRSALVVLATVGAVAADAQTQNAASEPTTRNDYGKAQSWLCRPGRKDACSVDLTSTVVPANGKLESEAFTGSSSTPPSDCFYVYPTVSRDPGNTSDMTPGPEEKTVIQQQFARFTANCRLYAPLYRQLTLVGLRAGLISNTISFYGKTGYNDVVDAWKYYLEHYNDGRGVVLIGHSQGAAILEQLVLREIEGKPVQSRMISAMLIGVPLEVPKGADRGGTFKNVPLCREPSQTGCIIAYSSFRANLPPPLSSRFARASDPNLVVACTNPAALAGGSGELRPYLAGQRTELGATIPDHPWAAQRPKIRTPFVSLPGLLSAQCLDNENGSYLEIKLNADPADARADDIPGDIVVNGQTQSMWGLHLIDVNLALGNLQDLVATQTKAYLAKKKT